MDTESAILLPSMRHSFTGRVRNFNLPPTAGNSMMPVYEAITNAVYAIQERYPETWADEGVIRIEVLREEPASGVSISPPVIGYVVSDNGIGLHDNLFSHFQELDTEYRVDKKGRGIGRLSYLKVFAETQVKSTFERDGQRLTRVFDFRLSNDQPFANYQETRQPVSADTGTRIALYKYRDAFKTKAMRDSSEIQNQILAHFIALFAQPKRLKINFIDNGKPKNLSDLFFNSIVGEPQTVPLQIDDVYTAKIQHLLLPKKLAPIGNSLIYCAADRAVVTKSLNEVIGLKSLPSEEHGGLIYIGLSSGDLFDDTLNHERTGFDFGDVDFEVVNKVVVDETRRFLDPYLQDRRHANRELLDNLLRDNPMYCSAIDDVEQYVSSMPLNWDETKLVQDVALKRHRAKKALFKQIEKLEASTASMTDEEFAERVTQLSASLGDTEKSALAQYVVERRMVIELLKTRRKRSGASGVHESENVVHEVFCPLGVTSDVMDYDDHNLWLIDDRLAFYSYVASDKQVRTFARDAGEVSSDELERRDALAEMGAYTESGEPDLAIFKRPMLFRRSNTPDPVVIVEFKSPSKISYSGAPNDNPVVQIRKYIESLQTKTCYDFDNNRIQDIGDKTPFHCFLIAEASEQLYALLRSHAIYKPTPDGHGRFGYLDDLNAYFEFIPYEQVLRNATLRNEAFFRKLNLQL